MRYSLTSVVRGQVYFLTAGRSSAGAACALATFFGLPLASPLVQEYLRLHLDKDTVATVVSAASIFAGLLLNLLVILHGQLPTTTVSTNDEKSDRQVRQTVEAAFYCISYAVVVSAALVLCSLIVLSKLPVIERAAECGAYYFGCQLFLCIALILRLCHLLFEFRLTRFATKRSETAEAVWSTLRAPANGEPNRDRPAA